MSNYPPGVSGGEYAISGPTFEKDERRKCETTDIEIITLPLAAYKRLAEQLLALTAKESGDVARWELARLHSAICEAEKVVVAECPFDDDVTILGYGHEKWWTCPVCFTEHTEHTEDELEGYED